MTLPRHDWLGGGTILAVEDDELTRLLIRRTLERLGFEVLEAADGREALAIFARRSQDIRAVLLDLSLPSLCGEAAVREMRRIRPDVRIVVMTGHHRQAAAKMLGGEPIAWFVQKPFGIAALLEPLRECLESDT